MEIPTGLSTAFTEGRVIPFLGAGVSYSAKVESAPGMPPAFFGQGSRGLTYYKRKLQRLRNLWSIRETALDRFAEQCIWVIMKSDSICWIDALKVVIKELNFNWYQYLLPTKAHRYMALMAREGLIKEFVTTNYDCCLERAFIETYPDYHSHDWQLNINNSANESLARVFDVYDCKSHRCFSGKNPRVGDIRRIKIYKINGCVRKQDEIPLLLAESQLQSWRDRSWARDMIRDRLRSKIVLFSGFSAEEPQIRHTAVLVEEEYCGESCVASVVPENEIGSGPLIVSRGEKSFPMMQIAVTAARAERNDDRVVERAEKRIIFSNSADEFWENTYVSIFELLISNLLKPTGSLACFLKTYLSDCDRRLAIMKRDLVSTGKIRNFCVLNANSVSNITKWLMAVRGIAITAGAYLPLEDNREVLGLMLFVMHEIFGWEQVIDGCFSHGLEVRIPRTPDDLNVIIYIAEHAPEEPSIQCRAVALGGVKLQLRLGDWRNAAYYLVRVEDNGEFRQSTIASIPLKLVLDEYAKRNQRIEFRQILIKMALSPGNIIDSHRSRYRNNGLFVEI